MVVHPDDGILPSTEKKWACKKEAITKWKKPIGKGYILYNSNYMTFQEGQNCGDG